MAGDEDRRAFEWVALHQDDYPWPEQEPDVAGPLRLVKAYDVILPRLARWIDREALMRAVRTMVAARPACGLVPDEVDEWAQDATAEDLLMLLANQTVESRAAQTVPQLNYICFLGKKTKIQPPAWAFESADGAGAWLDAFVRHRDADLKITYEFDEPEAPPPRAERYPELPWARYLKAMNEHEARRREEIKKAKAEAKAKAKTRKPSVKRK
jgi:hypothetical protein